MQPKNSRSYSVVLIIIDAFTLIAAFSLAYILRVILDPRPLLHEVYAHQYALSLLLIVPIWIIIFACLGLYSPSVYNRRFVTIGKVLLGCIIGIMILISWEYLGDEPIFPARLVVAYVFIGAFLLISIEREVVRLIRGLFFKKGRGVNNVLLVGCSETNRDIIKSLANTEKSGYKIVAVAGPKSSIPKRYDVKHYKTFEDAIRNLRIDKVNSIIQTGLFEDSSKNHLVLSTAQSKHISYSFIPGEPELYSGKNTVDVFFGYPIISVFQTPLIGWSAIFKRVFDLFVVIVLFPIWGLVFLVIVLLQKIFNPGPIFFVHTRMGRYKKRFKVYKFRSMIPEYCGQDAIKIFKKMGREDLAKEYAKTRKIKNDPRITKFGNIIRKTSLDELGQLINVIKGEMSLVGPRPIIPDEIEFYKSRSPLLFSVKPGLTGLASISGRSDLPFEKRVELELLYVQNWTFLLDLKILVKTVKVVLTKKGVA